jgi:hypothetical protein
MLPLASTALCGKVRARRWTANWGGGDEINDSGAEVPLLHSCNFDKRCFVGCAPVNKRNNVIQPTNRRGRIGEIGQLNLVLLADVRLCHIHQPAFL